MAKSREAGPVRISAETFRDLLDSAESFTLVDTRDEESFEGWHIDGAERYFHKPDREFSVEEFQETLDVDRGSSIVTICAKGKASKDLANRLHDEGFRDVRYVDGGMRAWSAVYDVVDITVPGDAAVVQLQRRAKGCLGYLVADPGAGVAAAVDVTRHTEEFRSVAADHGWEIERVLDTHVHADHISGGSTLAAELGVPYHLGERAEERDVGVDYVPLARNETVSVGEIELKAVFTPGHTSETASYLVDATALLSGDTVFVDGVGRTELQFGDDSAATGAEQLYDSLHGTVLAEPDDVVVLPGHFSVSPSGESGGQPGTEVSTTVRALRTDAPILQRDRDAFVEYVVDHVPEKPPNYEQVIAINQGREQPENEQEAVELEVGPNNCAAE